MRLKRNFTLFIIMWLMIELIYTKFAYTNELAVSKPMPILPESATIDFSSNPKELNFVNDRVAKAAKLKGLRLISKGGALLINLLSPELRYSTLGLNFTEMKFTDVLLKAACKNNCFFQGIDAGGGLFLPFRYVIINPKYKTDTENKEKPFLIVDVFRVGLNIGGNGVLLQSLIGYNVPASISFSMGGQVFMVYEYVRVRPIENLSDFFHNPKLWELLTLPLISFTHMRDDFLNNMQSGDALILSSYIGLKGGASVGWPAIETPVISPPQIELQVKGDMHRVSRVTLVKNDENNMLVDFSKINKAKLKAIFGLDFIFNIPFASAQARWRSFFERTFLFDLKDENEKQLLLTNFFSTHPRNIPDDLMLETRYMRLRDSYIRFEFLHLFKYQHSRRRSDVDYENYLTGEKGEEMSFTQQSLLGTTKNLLRSKIQTLDFKTSINDRGNIFTSAKVELYDPKATKKHFWKMINRVNHLIPKNFDIDEYYKFIDDFDNDKQDYYTKYIGDLTLVSKTVFSDKALEKFFSKDKQEICIEYAKVNNFSLDRCNNKHTYGLRIWAFLTDFEQAKNRFNHIKEIYKDEQADTLLNKRAVYRMLKEITDLFNRYGKRRDTIEIIKQVISSDDIYQELEIERKEDWLNYKITDGKFTPEIRHLSDYPEETFELFSDELHRSLEFVFYNNDLSFSDIMK
ncbi:MAG: hypothetical protein HQK49_15245 [Oligoflexia bacterium]|nr:hypothetical protein [Oligoflexia bacterium]